MGRKSVPFQSHLFWVVATRPTGSLFNIRPNVGGAPAQELPMGDGGGQTSIWLANWDGPSNPPDCTKILRQRCDARAYQRNILTSLILQRGTLPLRRSIRTSGQSHQWSPLSRPACGAAEADFLRGGVALSRPRDPPPAAARLVKPSRSSGATPGGGNPFSEFREQSRGGSI
jgi:hypothetical protein